MNISPLLSAAVADPITHWLMDVTVRSTFLLLIVAGVVLAAGRFSSARRHFLWCLGLIGTLVLPIVVGLTPSVQWKVIPLGITSDSTAVTSARTSMGEASNNEPRTIPSRTAEYKFQGSSEVSAIENPVSSVTPTVREEIRPTFLSRPTIPFILWAIGVLFTGAYFAVGYIRILRLQRNSKPILNEKLSQHVREIAASTGLRESPLLMQSHEVAVPFTWGHRPAVIVLPEDWMAWTPERRRFVLMHEMAHVRRHDWATQWMGWVAVTVYWFNPIVWFAAKQLTHEAEKACDDAVLRAGHAPSQYAEQLLAISTASLQLQRQPFPQGISMAQSPKIDRRIRAILEVDVNRKPSSRPLAVGAILGLTVLLPVLAAVEITSKDDSAVAAPSQSKTTEITTSSPPLKDSIRSVSSPVSIEILVSGSDELSHGLLSPDGKKIAFEGWNWRKGNEKKDDVIVRELLTGTEVPVTLKAYDKSELYEFANFNFGNGGAGCWSPDSQWIAYKWYRSGTGNFELRIAKADGSETRVLKETHSWSPYAWSPGGQHLICEFDLRPDKGEGAALLNIETGEITEVPKFERPAFSPNGRWIVGAKINKGSGDVYLINLKTLEAHSLVADPSDERTPRFSRDGRHVLFTSNRRGNWDLWAVKVKEGKKGGEPMLVKRDFGNHPIRILDSGQIVFYTRDINIDVFSVTVGSDSKDPISPPRRLSSSHHGKNSGVAWSPDGTRVAYVRSPDLICIQNIQTGTEELIDPKIQFRPQTRQLFWSPNGEHLAFEVTRGGKIGFFSVYSLKDKQSRLQAEQGFPREWSLDGNHFYVSLQRKIFEVNIADGTREEISFPEFDQVPHDFDISPDGQKILAFLHKADEFSKIVLLDRSNKSQRTVAHYGSWGQFRGPRWSPDGNRFAYFDLTFTDSDKLVVASANGDFKKSIKFPTAALSSFGKPPAWSPDGSQIALTINDGDFGEIGLLSVDLP